MEFEIVGKEGGMAVREILFRGKRPANGEWVCGHYHYNAVVRKHIILSDSDWMFYTAAAETVGQCTGRRDRFGVKIFEGDLVKATWQEHSSSDVRNSAQGVVEYSPCWAGYVINNKSDKIITEMNGQWLRAWEVEIIGNKYEDKEYRQNVELGYHD